MWTPESHTVFRKYLGENEFLRKKHFKLFIGSPVGFDSWKKCQNMPWHCHFNGPSSPVYFLPLVFSFPLPTQPFSPLPLLHLLPLPHHPTNFPCLSPSHYHSHFPPLIMPLLLILVLLLLLSQFLLYTALLLLPLPLPLLLLLYPWPSSSSLCLCPSYSWCIYCPSSSLCPNNPFPT